VMLSEDVVAHTIENNYRKLASVRTPAATR
jgi:hypothetical protein